MAESVLWQPLLREAIAVLALPPDEKVRVNGPGCVACDLLENFDHAQRVALENATLSDEQCRVLSDIDSIMQAMEKADTVCFDNAVLLRPAGRRLRDLAFEALREFGWDGAVVEPFTEIEPGVWKRS